METRGVLRKSLGLPLKALAGAFFLFIFLTTLTPISLSAQELHQDQQGIWRAKVVDVIEEEYRPAPWSNIETLYQILEVEILEGDRAGETVVIENDYFELKKGDRFFLNYLITVDGREIFSVRDVDRKGALIFFALLFVATILIFGRWQGLRALISLTGTFLVIIYVLLPLLLQGYSPILVSTSIAAVVLFIVIFFTHGFNRESSVALAGTVVAVTLTSILAFLAVKGTQLTGFTSDEALYLNLSTFGQLDFSGLLLGGIIIGALGVLDDIAITQSAVVSELYGANPKLTKREAYQKAMRVGREHAGALVNTLALAYAGASLPLLLLFSSSELGIAFILNQEIFATEIVRTIAGSIGLILTIPITTLLASVILYKYRGEKPAGGGHSHSHGHVH